MKIGLIDLGGKFPNLALMKLSAYHKAKGDTVELVGPLYAGIYDKIYASAVFTWTPLPVFSINEIGGPAIGPLPVLPPEINDLCPDYSLYKIDYSMGYTTRGCNRNCMECFVPELEGGIRPEHDIDIFLRHDKAVLLDNNALAHPWGISQIENIARREVKVDYCQGFDARLIDGAVARLLAKVRFFQPLRLACDNVSMIVPVNKAVERLRAAGVTPSRYACYVLVKDIPTAIARVEFLRAINVDPFAQPFRDRDGSEPPEIHRRFARWVNHKAIFKTVRWQDYNG